MKYFIKFVSLIGLFAISQLAYAAPITDTYTTGDTLTAGTLDNIKSAVNDNDTRITAIEGASTSVAVDCSADANAFLNTTIQDNTIYTLTGMCNGPIWVGQGKNVTIQGGIAGAALSGLGSDSVLIMRGATVVLRDLTINAGGSGHGISMEGSSIDVERIVVLGASGSGMRIDGSSFAIVVDSEFNNSVQGIVITGSSNAFLVGNTAQNNSSSGIVVNLNSSATVDGNTIINNQVGILVTKMSSLALHDNLIENNVGPGVLVADQYGYLTTDGSVNTIQGNGTDVECQTRGIFDSQVAQISNTFSTSLFGCTVLGTVF
jgi:parallel beta-helix repeat protein